MTGRDAGAGLVSGRRKKREHLKGVTKVGEYLGRCQVAEKGPR